ncbi:hypothetical protein LCGC14_1213150 [marine sediment metagenome]|uniref:Uncharacterized protein n=2 Tax=root TaxID=1 RepID=A0A831QM84_9FLAO|nr:hypothetical protein [Pricia sp.]HEA21125.1 hypothetical protein [Pricia antarctica]
MPFRIESSTTIHTVFRSCLPFALLLCINSCFLSKKAIRYSVEPTFTANNDDQKKKLTSFGDSLFLVEAKDGLPDYYFQQYNTGVCYDNKCRPLSISIYWSVTGRYLGFELPKEEFLSKTDHEPFVPEDYEFLNKLLANPDLPFADIEYYELMDQPSDAVESVDAVSGATSARVSNIVVKGAVYTTYSLWNIVHGRSQEFIQEHTGSIVTTHLIEKILRDSNRSDKVWVLERFPENIEMTSLLLDTIEALIVNSDFHLAYTAIHAIKAPRLNSEAIQEMLFKAYAKSNDPSIKSLIISKLGQAPFLSNGVINVSRSCVDELKGQELVDLLKLLKKHEVKDDQTLQAVENLLSSDNVFIVRQAQKFLKQIQISNE